MPGGRMMIDAREARKRAQDNLASNAAKELSLIETLISDAVSKGAYFITYGGPMQARVREKLDELGYKVEIDSQYNDVCFIVSWEQD